MGDAEANSGELKWRCHTPNLLQEVLTNNSAWALKMPLTLFAAILHELAELAAEIDDPRLHLIMMRLALYEAGDPQKTPMDEIRSIEKKLNAEIEVRRTQ